MLFRAHHISQISLKLFLDFVAGDLHNNVSIYVQVAYRNYVFVQINRKSQLCLQRHMVVN